MVMGKNRHGGEIKGDTPDLTCDRHSFEISYHATLGHKHKIWDPWPWWHDVDDVYYRVP